jgi:rare lipoprotein A
MGTLSPRANHGVLRAVGRVGRSALAPAAGALLLAAGLSSSEAKTPGKSYCFYGKCHRVKTIAETEALVGKDEIISASHYDSCKRDRYNPCGLTSSGAEFDSEAPDNAASPIYPDGTTLLVRSPATGVALVVRVNNAGPYWGDRKLDLSRKAAEVLGFAGQGVARLEVRVIDAPSVEEATYKARRVYDPVPGYVGAFASLDAAQAGAATAYMVAGLQSPFASGVVTETGTPVQLAAGAAGTQSGPAVAMPMAVALAEVPPPAALAAKEVAETEAPVRVAALVASTEVADTVAAARSEEVAKPARARSYAERTSPRNSRTYRQAQRRDKAQRNKAMVAALERKPKPAPVDRKIVTLDGTNDMSMFARHTYAGVDRIAAQEPRRRVSAGYGRDDNEG